MKFSDHQLFFHEDTNEMVEVYLKSMIRAWQSHKLSKTDKSVKMFFDTDNDSSQQSDNDS